MSNEIQKKFTPEGKDGELDFDLNYARQNITDLIETGIAGAQELSQIVSSSQRPSDYAHLSSMLKTVSDLNKDLVQISKTKNDTNLPNNEPTPITNNNMFVGSTSEIATMLADLRKKSNN